MTENDLILAVIRAQHGDTRAFDALVRQFQNQAVSYARTLLFDPATAEDAAQEAFVQAWRDLPRLLKPEAFRSWLRRIIFKYCDRAHRSARPTLHLDDMLEAPASQRPAFIAEQAEEAAQVRRAIDALPAALAEVTSLYYLMGHDIKESAVALGLPPSTVKNRLHAARKQLRKELWPMAKIGIEEDRTQNEVFAETVLARILREFQQQETADPHIANRELLDNGQAVLSQALKQEEMLETQMVHDGFLLLWRKWDFPALAGLLMRYLSQPLPDSETAWAYVHLANAVAMSGSAAGAVLAHETFERWLPGKSPSLSTGWPFFSEPDTTTSAAYRGDSVRLLFLSQSAEFATSYHGVWRGRVYLAKVDAALLEIPVTQTNRKQRFLVLRMASAACEAAENWAGVRHYIQQMYVLAAETEDATLKMELQSKAIGHEIHLAHQTQDKASFEARVAEMIALLAQAEQKDAVRKDWVRSERHNLACQLVESRCYKSALPLWEANAATGGQLGGWGWLLYAATIWQMAQNREQTLALLREACAHDDRDMLPLFAKCPEFADVQNDSGFRQAISRKSLAG